MQWAEKILAQIILKISLLPGEYKENRPIFLKLRRPISIKEKNNCQVANVGCDSF